MRVNSLVSIGQISMVTAYFPSIAGISFAIILSSPYFTGSRP
jgi:hypothetical protein